jgi:hypothetical protein
MRPGHWRAPVEEVGVLEHHDEDLVHVSEAGLIRLTASLARHEVADPAAAHLHRTLLDEPRKSPLCRVSASQPLNRRVSLLAPLLEHICACMRHDATGDRMPATSAGWAPQACGDDSSARACK